MYTKQFFLDNIAIHYEAVYKKIRYMTNENVAEDLTQVSMEKAWQNINRLQDPAKAKSWVFTIATNEVKQYYRYQAKIKERMVDREPDENEIGEELHFEDVLQTLIASESSKKLIACIDELEYRYQSVVKLRYYAELSMAEIAEILGMNAATVRVYVRRALAKIKSSYDEDDFR